MNREFDDMELYLSSPNNNNNNTVNITYVTSGRPDTEVPSLVNFVDSSSSGLVDEETLNTFVFFNTVIFNGAIGFIGCVFNAINVTIFYRLGFKDTVNISLFSLALADFGALLPLISRNPYFYEWSKIPVDYQEFQFFTAGTPNFCFARISSLITAFVTFERCLCIAMPLKVRTIITPKRTAIIMMSIFLLIISSIAPMYFTMTLGPKYFPERNKTLIGLIYFDYGILFERVAVTFNIFIQIFSVVVVIVCTIILVVELKQKSAWRTKTTGTRDSTSNVRDLKVVKMVLFISIIFIICFFPSAVNLIAMATVPGYNIRGQFSNLFVLTWALFNTMESTNSSVNIFVYLRMSSKYSGQFFDMFGFWTKLCCIRKKKKDESK